MVACKQNSLRLIVIALLATVTVACGNDDTMESGADDSGSATNDGDGGVEGTVCPPGDGTTELTMAWNHPNASVVTQPTAIVGVAEDAGFFEENGIEPDMVYTQGPIESLQAVVGGAADLANSEPSAILKSRAAGSPVLGISVSIAQFPWRMVTTADSDLDSLDELAGKKIGVIAPNSGSNTFAEVILADNGISRSDVELVPVGFGAAAGEALKNGDIDAMSYFTSGFTNLESAGFELGVIENSPWLDDVVNQVFVTTESKFEDDGDALGCFLQAYFAGVMLTEADPETAMATAVERYPTLLGNSSKAEALETLPGLMEEWIPTAIPDTAASEQPEFGPMTEVQWEASIRYEETAGDVEFDIPFSEGWTNDLVPIINDFDLAEVQALAE